VSEGRVFRSIIGPKKKEVEGDWRKLRNEKLHQVLLDRPNLKESGSRGM
jgi:hypothetical protein